MIKNSKILFLTPFFYDYHDHITAVLNQYNNSVVLVNNQEFNGEYYSKYSKNIFHRVFCKLFPIYQRYLSEKRVVGLYREKYQQALGNRYDVVFCIRGDYFPDEIYKAIHRNNPDASFVYYSYDSFKHMLKTTHLRFFNRKYTFDPVDARKCRLSFLPLFYAGSTSIVSNKKDIDLLFVSSYTPERLQLLKKTEALLSAAGTKFVFKHHMYTDQPLEPGEKYLTNKQMPYHQYLELMYRAKSTIDLIKKDQHGATIRTIESLFTRTKLISNNSLLKDYDFYIKDNILMLSDMESGLLPFLDAEYKEIKEDILQSYTIASWCEVVFTKP